MPDQSQIRSLLEEWSASVPDGMVEAVASMMECSRLEVVTEFSGYLSNERQAAFCLMDELKLTTQALSDTRQKINHQMGRVDDFVSAVRYAIDPELQLSHENVVIVREWLNACPDFPKLLEMADEVNRTVVHPWLAERNTRQPGYLGNINGPGCDPDTV